MIAVGIDPGKSGGVAFIYTDSKGDVVAHSYVYDDMVFIDKMRDIKDMSTRVSVCVEKVNAMPKQGVVSVFTFGKSLGFIEGVLKAFNLPYQLVPPTKWRSEFSLTGDKSQSITVCQKLFPDVNLMATMRCRKPHDGMAEALLMAEYARRRF